MAGAAIADDGEETAAGMAQAKERMPRLEHQVEATKVRAHAQEEQIREAGLDETRPVRNALSAYLDYTLNIREIPGTRFVLHGFAAAARLALRDGTGVAIRGEVGLLADPEAPFNDNLWTVTATIDHALTDNLTTLTEVRYDGVSDGLAASGGGFWNESGTSATRNGQALFIAQLVYEF